jgi:hypothetical protein
VGSVTATSRLQTHFYGDGCPGGHWIGAWARAIGASPALAHTIRGEHPKGGWITFCGMRLERITDQFAEMATDCYGCRMRRDR